MTPQEMEATVLSGLLVGGATPDALDVISTMPEEAFSIRFHRETYREIKKQALTHGVIDVVLISESLGGDSLSALVEISRMPGTLANLKGFATLATKGWRSRQMATLLQEGADSIRNARNQEQRDAAIQSSVTKLIEMSADTGGVVPVHLGELLGGYMDVLDKRLSGDVKNRNLQTGIAELDTLTGGFNPQDLIVIAGRPGMGKTEFALKVVEGATRKGGGALIFSMEMAAMQMVERSVAGAGNLPVSKLRNPIDMCDEDWGRISSALETLNNRDIWIVDATELNVDQIRAIAETHKRRYPHLSMVMVDYLGLIQKPKAERHDLAVGHISRSLKTLAMRTKTPCFALSQLSRKVDERPAGNRRPIMSDLRDSGSVEQDADSIIMLYREGVYSPESPAARYAEVIVAKNRFGENGTVYQEFKNGHFLPVDQITAQEATRMNQEASQPKANQRPYATKKF
ncbi:replicative DNA helicase [Serratia odorifera]|uniref:replicative DNA helicase n=1 Tax=Serratia odorifera TaxID=618 RepID=UPI002362550B|nr:replicative DNA helicase [Serratia odorifera]